MKVNCLRPTPEYRMQFAWSHYKKVPENSGCYALVTYGGEVLYVGLATTSIRDRMKDHLDTPKKTKAGPVGAPFWIYYTLCSSVEVNPIERGWMNQAILEDGAMPLLNGIYSPL
jgi:hypothetical protein